MKLRERNKESATNVACRGRNRADGIGSKKQTSWRHIETTTHRRESRMDTRRIDAIHKAESGGNYTAKWENENRHPMSEKGRNERIGGRN